MEWMFMPLKRYAQFSGRSRRQEFWMFALFQFLLYMVLTVVALVIGVGAAGLGSARGTADGAAAGMFGMFAALGIFFLFYVLLALALLIPNLAVAVRRLHDTNRSGLWLFAYIGPYMVGYILTIIGSASRSTGLAAVGGIISLVGFLGAIVLLVFYCLPGTPGPNQYGPDPLGGAVGAPGYQPQGYGPQPGSW